MTVLLVPTATSGQCGDWDFICELGRMGRDLVETVANAPLALVADSFLNGWAQLEMLFLSSWIAIPLLVDVTDPNGTVAWLQEVLGSFTFLFAVLGALVTAAWTFIALGPQKVKNLGVRLLVLLLITTTGPLLVATLDWGVRQASIWLLGQVGAGVGAASSAVTSASLAVAPAVTLVIGLIAVLGVFVQWLIMIARGPLVVLLLGVWPLTAAAATLGVGKAEASFERVTAWLFAFVIYPFPAALVYAAAFRLKGGQDGILGVVYGLALELMAILMLPAIFRIIAPQTKILGEKFGGQVAAKAVVSAAETAVAVGAAVVGAGALSGMLAAKAGAAGASAGGAGGGSGLSGAFHAAPTVADPTPGTSGSGNAGAGAGAGGSRSSGTPGRGAGGAAPVGAETATPTGDTVRGAAPASAATPPDTGRPAGSGGSAGAQTPAPARQDTPAPAAPSPRPRGSGARAQAAGQAAYAAGQTAGRSARESLDDIDDIVGGRHD